MTTPRIDEMVRQFAKDTGFMPMEEALTKALTEAHQAGRDEAVEIMEKMREKECKLGGFGHSHDPWSCGEKLCEYCKHNEEDRCEQKHKGYNYSQINAYNQALDDTIKALQDNK